MREAAITKSCALKHLHDMYHYLLTSSQMYHYIFPLVFQYLLTLLLQYSEPDTYYRHLLPSVQALVPVGLLYSNNIQKHVKQVIGSIFQH